MATTQNTNRDYVGVGQLYIIDYPTSGYTGANYAAVKDAIIAAFLTADTGALKGGLIPYAVLDANGLEMKLGEEVVKFDPNVGVERILATTAFSAEAEFTFLDSDVAHFQDMYSSTASQIKTQVAATGKVGYTATGFGGTSVKKKYSLAYLTPNPIQGLDALILPRVKFNIDTDLKLNKKSPQIMKVKVFTEPEPMLINPDTLLPDLFIKYQVNAAAL